MAKKRKNDFLYYQGWTVNNHEDGHFVIGGRHKLPMWLALTSWGLIVVTLVVVGCIIGGVGGTAGSWAFLSWSLVLSLVLPLALYVLFWTVVGAREFVKAWRKVFRGSGGVRN